MTRFGIRSMRLLAVAAIAFGLAQSASAQFTIGNLVIYRVGDGSATLGTTATAVFLNEYTIAGGFVQEVPLPTSGSTAMTCVGNATTEGIMSRSQDGNFLVFTGYRKDAGGSNPSSDAPATTNRIIGTANLAGVVNTSVALTDPTGTIRSATSVDTTSTFYIGTSTSVRYVPTPGPAATTVQIDARNSRQVTLYDNNLYASNGSTAITAKVQSYGNLPTGATVPTPVVNLATADAVNGFFMADLNPLVPGVDTVYVCSTVENLLRKYTFDGAVWNANGSISAGGTSNLTGVVNGNNVDLYLTSSGSLFAFSDTSGIGGTIMGTLGAAIATAPTNTAFRGIAFAPVPEPASVTAICFVAGAIAMKVRNRRKQVLAD